MPVTYMEDAYSDDSDDEMDGDSGEEADADLGAEDGSIPIPPTSEAWLKQQREAHERFVYAVQIEEMRRQCAAYFARLHRVGASTASNDSNNVNTNATTGSSGSTIPQQTSRPAKPGPGF
ncbi:hypothetical protein HXX76_000968 [Chlamydomonas incerta]|uniref:Uncharacterized protein n=1 Tax=Chlamydomonas incerta TaxID=51695 RepID=A0A835WFB1_CHLIN|nr:hypothetical protein HXX76_000968 [Chlamydomonas incerta]|eukprot:KAG2446383.1 hypothetical protein HXX76_000968 [Chlamydomonas incerta]